MPTLEAFVNFTVAVRVLMEDASMLYTTLGRAAEIALSVFVQELTRALVDSVNKTGKRKTRKHKRRGKRHGSAW